ncbi:RNA polymerase sigma-70 factor [Bacillus sp. NRRL B-14911]|nr:RNA polymerase sigma-70 factor [Bacillus sp. NRRL B-14911]
MTAEKETASIHIFYFLLEDRPYLHLSSCPGQEK